jgi:hypothetical protein
MRLSERSRSKEKERAGGLVGRFASTRKGRGTTTFWRAKVHAKIAPLPPFFWAQKKNAGQIAEHVVHFDCFLVFFCREPAKIGSRLLEVSCAFSPRSLRLCVFFLFCACPQHTQPSSHAVCCEITMFSTNIKDYVITARSARSIVICSFNSIHRQARVSTLRG